MSLLARLKTRVEDAAKAVVRLPVVRERIVEDADLERALAKRGQVPKRCGLCRNFRAADMAETLRMNKAFGQAASLLSPQIMGHLKTAPKKIAGSETARELRPGLSDRWEDYGGCTANPGTGVWAYAEQPVIGDEDPKPCEIWR